MSPDRRLPDSKMTVRQVTPHGLQVYVATGETDVPVGTQQVKSGAADVHARERLCVRGILGDFMNTQHLARAERLF